MLKEQGVMEWVSSSAVLASASLCVAPRKLAWLEEEV